MHGCCSSFVLLPERTAMFALCILTCVPLSRPTTMRLCAVFLCTLLGVDPSFLFWNVASLPLSLGGLGLRSASLLGKLG